MNSVDLIYALKERLYDNALSSYKKSYREPINGTDKYSESISFFQSLTEIEQEKIFFLLKTTMWDTLSDFLGWLDGVYFLSGQTKNVVLKLEGDEKEKKMNGYLQDIWINIDERMDKDEIEDMYD